VKGRRVARLTNGAVSLRGLRMRDGPAWIDVRLRNERWLTPWEALPPAAAGLSWAARHTVPAYTAMLRTMNRQIRAGTLVAFGIWVEDRLVGQVTVGAISRGAINSGSLGYWIDERVAGRGIMPAAITAVAVHCFGPLGLHRLEADIRPRNLPSRRVAAKLGFTEEGVHRSFLFIEGAYRDHLCHTLLAEDAAAAALRRSPGWPLSKRPTRPD
jgi:ribosomal-protein-alanine N-acetyltransferase